MRNGLGHIFRERMNRMIKKTKLVNLVRGKGLLNAIVINDAEDSKTAWNLCVALKENGPVGQTDPRQHHPLCPTARYDRRTTA